MTYYERIILVTGNRAFCSLGSSGDHRTLGVDKLFGFGPVFISSALRLPLIFIEPVGETLYFFMFSEWAWQIDHTVRLGLGLNLFAFNAASNGNISTLRLVVVPSSMWQYRTWTLLGCPP